MTGPVHGMLMPVSLSCTLMTPLWRVRVPLSGRQGGGQDPHMLPKGHRRTPENRPFSGEGVGLGLGCLRPLGEARTTLDSSHGSGGQSTYFTEGLGTHGKVPGGGKGADQRVRKAGDTLPAWQFTEDQSCASQSRLVACSCFHVGEGGGGGQVWEARLLPVNVHAFSRWSPACPTKSVCHQTWFLP